MIDAIGRPPAVYVPKLVEHCREALGMIDKTHPLGRWLVERFHQCGITESVLPPAERPDV